jgi:RNA polymerase sigma-70 factor (ECF subfamily)
LSYYLEEKLSLSDRELIEEIRDGSAPAFELLMRRYERLVYKIALTSTGNGDSAMDISQNVFLKVHSKLPSFREGGNFKSWVARIAMNESINWHRRGRKHQTAELNEEISTDERLPQEEQLGDKEKWALLKQAMLELNPKQQLAVAMRYFEGMSIGQISTALECSEGSAKSILFRGLGRMRAQLAQTQEVPS